MDHLPNTQPDLRGISTLRHPSMRLSAVPVHATSLLVTCKCTVPQSVEHGYLASPFYHSRPTLLALSNLRCWSAPHSLDESSTHPNTYLSTSSVMFLLSHTATAPFGCRLCQPYAPALLLVHVEPLLGPRRHFAITKVVVLQLSHTGRQKSQVHETPTRRQGYAPRNAA